MPQKYLIINYGPPASGKSTILNKILHRFKIRSFFDASIDNRINKYISDNNIKIKNFDEDKYWELRNIVYPILDNEIDIAFTKNKSIVFEVTGKNIGFTVEHMVPSARKYNFVIILVMPVVKLGDIISRCKNRKQVSNCSSKFLKELRESSYLNFITLADLSEIVIVYDNNGETTEVYMKSYDDVACNMSKLKTDKSPSSKKFRKYLKNKCAKSRRSNRKNVKRLSKTREKTIR